MSVLEPIYAMLSWLKRNPDIPTTPHDRIILKLIYGSHETEMGWVAETSDGQYWCCTTNSNIYCMPPKLYLKRYSSKDEAGSVLVNYVADEIFRLIRLESDMPFEIVNTFKRRDRGAFVKYVESGAIKGEGEIAAFKCGMDWILRSEGMVRRPSWAKYVAQNRDGQRFWFENEPTLNRSAGVWESDGRSMLVGIEEWPNSLIKLD